MLQFIRLFGLIVVTWCCVFIYTSGISVAFVCLCSTGCLASLISFSHRPRTLFVCEHNRSDRSLWLGVMVAPSIFTFLTWGQSFFSPAVQHRGSEKEMLLIEMHTWGICHGGNEFGASPLPWTLVVRLLIRAGRRHGSVLSSAARWTKEDVCQLYLELRSLAVVKLAACVCFCFLLLLHPSPTHHWPPPETTRTGGIKVVLFCATDPSLGEAAEALDNRSLEEILGSIPPPPPPAMTNEPGAPRLMITHLVNRNFKSYAGEEILGPFHKVGCKRDKCKCCLLCNDSKV